MSNPFSNLISRYVPTLDDSANDYFGANDGTYVGGMGTVSDIDIDIAGIRAYEFDGSNDYIDVSGSLSDPSTVTITGWIKIDIGSGVKMLFAHRDSSNDLIQLFVNGTIPTANIRTSGTSLATVTGSALTVGVWYHLAASFDKSGSHKLYVNGVEVDSDTTVMSGTCSSAKQYVGAYDDGSIQGYHDGRIDDVCVFSVVKSATDIVKLASARGVVPSLNQLYGVDVETLGTVAGAFDFGPYKNQVYGVDVETLGTVSPPGFDYGPYKNQLYGLSIEVLGTNQQPIINDSLQITALNYYCGDGSTVEVCREYLNRDLIVNISSSNPGVATVPSTVTIPSGQACKTFVATKVAYGATTITASYVGLDNVSGEVSIPGSIPLLETNLLHYWNLDDDGVWADSEGSWNLTETNTPTTDGTAPDGSATCLDLDTGDNLTRTDVAWDGGGDAKSISVWAKMDAFNSGGNWIVSHRKQDVDAIIHQVLFLKSTNSIRAYFGGDNGTFFALGSTTTAVTGVWYHIVVTSNGTNSHKLYINGVLEDTKTTALSSTPTGAIPFRVGAASFAPTNTTYEHEGQIVNLGIWDRELTAENAEELFNTGIGKVYGDLDGINPVGSSVSRYVPTLDDSPNDHIGVNDGVYQGSMTTVADTDNGGIKAYQFDGVDDYINFSTPQISAYPSTISFWMKTSTTDWQTMVCHGANNTTEYISIGTTNTGKFRYNIRSSNIDMILDSTSQVDDGAWHHVVALSESSSKHKIYIDGALEGTDTSTRPFPVITKAAIGVLDRNTLTSYFNGLVDDVIFFNTAKTAAEVQALASDRGFECVTAALPTIARYNICIT